MKVRQQVLSCLPVQRPSGIPDYDRVQVYEDAAMELGALPGWMAGDGYSHNSGSNLRSGEGFGNASGDSERHWWDDVDGDGYAYNCGRGNGDGDGTGRDNAWNYRGDYDLSGDGQGGQDRGNDSFGWITLEGV